MTKKHKSETYVFTHDTAKSNALEDMCSTPVDGEYEWVKRPVHQSKTLAQLGGLFGCWLQYLSTDLGESEDYLHRMLKAKFLARIYVTEPCGNNQEQWVELLAIYQETGQQEELKCHAKRISLSWCNSAQMSEYLHAIENHYISIGKPLPILDKFRKAYE